MLPYEQKSYIFQTNTVSIGTTERFAVSNVTKK